MAKDFLATSGVTIVCNIYILLVVVLYSLKAKNNRISSKTFARLLWITFISMTFYIVTGYFSSMHLKGAMILGRILSFAIVSWEYYLIYYLSITFRSDEENKEHMAKHKTKYIIAGIIITIINIVLSIVLSFGFNQKAPGLPYTMTGNLMLYYNVIGLVALLSTIVFLVIHRKRVGKLAKILCFMSMVYCILSFVLEAIIHEPVNDVPFIQSIVIFFLYLSQESQDALLLDSYNESVKQAEESNKLKAEFIMNMSHQLRTPMNTILGFSESILTTEELTLEGVKEDSENIKIASKRLLDLINSILDISKIESKKEVLNNEDYNLDSIIYDVSSHINSKINKDNLVFTINANSNCPNDLYGDGYKLCKILNIILYNAIKNTEYGEVSLNVSSSVVDAENHEFTFHIKNTGHAMKVESFERNFDDLMRLNSEGNNDIDADTLKIIVAKGLLNILGGTIDFINQKGQGTQYIIKVKQKVTTQNELGNIREKIQTKHDVSHEIISLIGKKALIIDDKKINSIILERLLEQYNITVESITNPRDGIEKAVNLGYDIIFVDHEMEEMTGEEVVKKLEASGNKIPPVVGLLTGITEVKDIKNYTVTLNCPIEFRALNNIINKLFKETERGEE